VTPAEDVLDDLRAGLPESAVLSDPDLTAGYRRDEAHLCPAGLPLAVVLPRETAHVQHAVRVASRHGVPVVPQGARSGLSGGANAVDGCVVLSLQQMDRILALEAPDRYAVVQPGVVNAALADAAAAQGLAYPPDPSSRTWSTLGGNIATNAGGLCCVKYGVTADFVLGLEVVLADGSVLRTGRRTVKGVAGYDLTRLFVGSEGTLGVVTEATLALRPAAGTARTLAAVFLSTAAAGAAVAAITAAGCLPSLLEIVDGATLRAIEDLKPLGTPPGAAALLLAQCDTGDHAAGDLAVLADLCRRAGAQDVIEASDAAESSMLLEARRLAYPALERLGVAMVDDVAVPRSRLAAFLDGVERIAERTGLLIGVVGHAGDGNMHPTVVFARDNEQAAAAATTAFGDVMQLGLDLGGTITGEHGIGLLKRDWLEREVGPVSMRVQHGLKDLLDPQGLLNPGKVLRAR
jgi:glycolate oxidase